MNFWKIGLGVGLFLTSSMIGQLLGLADFSLVLMGRDYAPDLTAKVLDVLAGSLIIWGILDFSPRGSGGKKRGRKR